MTDMRAHALTLRCNMRNNACLFRAKPSTFAVFAAAQRLVGAARGHGFALKTMRNMTQSILPGSLNHRCSGVPARAMVVR
jgi:hypothetical protein